MWAWHQTITDPEHRQAANVLRCNRIGAFLKRDLIAHHGTLDFVAAKDNVGFLGPPGTGKTQLSVGLASAAAHAGYRSYLTTAADAAA